MWTRGEEYKDGLPRETTWHTSNQQKKELFLEELSCAARTTQHFSSQKYEQLQNRSWRKDPVITVKVNSLDAALISEPLSHLLPGTGQISSTAGLL